MIIQAKRKEVLESIKFVYFAFGNMTMQRSPSLRVGSGLRQSYRLFISKPVSNSHAKKSFHFIAHPYPRRV